MIGHRNRLCTKAFSVNATRMVAGVAGATTVLIVAACSSTEQPSPASAAPTTPTVQTTVAWSPPVYRNTPSSPGDVVVTRDQLIGNTVAGARELLSSGSWKPEILEGTYVSTSPGQPAPDTASTESWRIVGACFTPDYKVRITAKAPEQFHDSELPRMRDGRYDSSECHNGWNGINLSQKP